MLPTQIKRLIEAFGRLPGIGPKSAERLTFYLLKQPDNRIQELSQSVGGLKVGLQYCKRCCNISEQETCKICDNPSRDHQQICVVEDALDVVALESSGAFKGLYHVLHGALSPLDNIGPEQLTISQLSKRLDDEDTQEIIFATNPTVTGEATAGYITRQVQHRSLKLTYLAQGIPMGGHLEFTDPDTLKRALVGRRER